MEQLKGKAEALGLSGRIVWAGFQEDVRPYLAAMDVLCHPTEKEACSRAILEAMSCGKAVVAFGDGGNPEIVHHDQSGLLVLPGDVPAMTAAVKGFLRDDVRRERTGMLARARVESEFSLVSNAEQTMGVYQTLCSLE